MQTHAPRYGREFRILDECGHEVDRNTFSAHQRRAQCRFLGRATALDSVQVRDHELTGIPGDAGEWRDYYAISPSAAPIEAT
jgi:hypothetical protein